jgi:type I restriction enzyme S subunit
MQDRRLVTPGTEEAKRLPYLGLEQIESQTGRILESSSSGSDVGISATFRFDNTHVLYGKLRPYLNKVALPEFPGRCTTEIIPLRPTDLADRSYLGLLLRSPAVLERAMQGNNGSRMPRADLDLLLSLKIPLPDLPTQRRIAAKLKEQLGEIEQARQAAEAEAEASGKLLEKFLVAAFHDICPLSLGINQASAPDGWAWKPLPSLARLESGHTPSRRCPEYWANGDVPWLALPDIRALDCRVANTTSESTNALGLANSSARLLPKDTVALSRTASVGFITIFDRPMATSQDFVNWICGADLHPKFLLWLLRAARKFILDQSTGAIHKTVYMDVVERFHVCIPSLAEQQNIAAKLDAIFEEVVSLRAAGTAQLAALQKLPAAFLREAFGGIS